MRKQWLSRIMKITAIITLAVMVAMFLLRLFLLTILGFFPLPYTPHNRNLDREQNEAIISLVEQAITVRYETHCMETLEAIFTDELEEHYEHYSRYYLMDVSTYYVSRFYMWTIFRDKEDQWNVEVGMHEGCLMSGYSFFLKVCIVKLDCGSYRIRYIGEG